MALCLEEVRKLEKRFLGLELQHIRRGNNTEADDIAKRASKRLPQRPGLFEERLYKTSITPPPDGVLTNNDELFTKIMETADGGVPVLSAACWSPGV